MPKLTTLVAASLPQTMQIAGINIAHSSGSTYWLLHHQDEWLILRLATHLHWLRGVRQLQVLYSDKQTTTELQSKLRQAFASPAAQQLAFNFTATDAAIANMLLWAAAHKLVFMLRLTPAMASAHKNRTFDLQRDFAGLPLFLGDRNNSNDLLLPIHDPLLQWHLILFYSENLLFTQFSSHRLIKLLPTAQWLQTLLATTEHPVPWPLAIATTFGTPILTAFHRARYQKR